MIVEPREIILSKARCKNGAHYYEVACPICGDVRSMRTDSLSRYEHTHCRGCSRMKDLRGAKFGRLTPLWPLYKDGGNRKWVCLCDCGTLTVVESHHVQDGANVSCGCYHREMSRARTGVNSPVWNPDKTDEERLNSRSNDVQYLEWAKLVKKRDNYVCVVCGKSISNGMVSHHLDAWRDYSEKRYSLDNGVCLCKDCHIKFHSIYGSGNNTSEQFYKYLTIS